MATVHPTMVARAPEVVTLEQIRLVSDVPTSVNAGNWRTLYPKATQLRHFEISQLIKHCPNDAIDIYVLLGEVLLPAPEWDELILMDHLAGGWEGTLFMVQGF